MGHAVFNVAHPDEAPAGPASPPFERLQAFVDKFAAIFGGEADRWLLKAVRELRGSIAVGNVVSGRAIAQDLAARLGKPELWVALEPPLSAEIAVFSKESVGHPRPVASTVFDEDHGWIVEKKE